LADILETSGAIAWLTEEWMAKLASSVQMMTEATPGLKLGSRDHSNVAEVPDALWYSIPLSLASDAAVFIGAAEDTWVHIGKSALVAAGVTELAPADVRSAYLEILTQATSSLAQSIGTRLEKPVSSLLAKEVKPGEDGLDRAASVNAIEITIGEPPPRMLYVAWSQGLESALAPKSDHALEKRSALPERSRTFDLLMEVELPVSVSFGRAQLPLRDVLKLNSGSIVELNRTISDPVEIIVNNCVIARGEVVVVEGNYGVRIHQVISREERLRTLK
jgi:flagellar motor switch protein FliN/FliY